MSSYKKTTVKLIPPDAPKLSDSLTKCGVTVPLPPKPKPNLSSRGFEVPKMPNLSGLMFGLLVASLLLNWALLTGKLVIPNVQYLATDFITTLDQK